MSDTNDYSEINGRIAAVREEIRIVTEQAAAESGGAVEERLSNRLAELEAELEELQKASKGPA